MTQRHRDWRARLNTFLASNAVRAFQWGDWDCCIGLAAGAVQAVRGDQADFAVGWRGKYRGKIGAFKQLKKRAGVDTPSALMTQLFGASRPPVFARTGDLVSFQGCIGVMSGADGIFIGCEMMGEALNREGLVRVPRAELEACWHV